MRINNICFAVFRKLCLQRRKLKFAPSSIKLLSYFSLIRQELEYASIVWDPHTKTNTKNLERTQTKAVRFIYGKFTATDFPTTLRTANGIDLIGIWRTKSRSEFISRLLNHKLALDPATYLSPLTSGITRHHYPQFSQGLIHLGISFHKQ